MYIADFAFASQSGRKGIAANTVAFMLGIATMFSLLGASASALGSLLVRNQQVLLLIGGAVIMAFGVMSLLGRDFTGFSRKNASTQPANTKSGSYVFGLTFSVGWSSCVGSILGVVLTLAASTGSVATGTALLFIYAMGLGLPLIIVSTFFGRADRNSWFWRLMRGRGWMVDTHELVVGFVWGAAIWFVLNSIAIYAIGPAYTTVAQIGLLLVVLAGVLFWMYLKSADDEDVTLNLHSTQIFSDVLFILMAVLMLNGTLAEFNSLIPPDLAIWFGGVEDGVIDRFS